MSISAVESDARAAELAIFERMLAASRGCFSCSLAICNTPALRDWIIARVKQSFPAIHLVRVPPNTIDVYTSVIEQSPASLGLPSPHASGGEGPGVRGPSSAPCDGIFIIGLEDSVPKDEMRSRPTIRSLNASRDLWERRYACPVVFWFPEYAVPILVNEAPDLWRYLSHHFEFVSERSSVAAGAQDAGIGDFSLVAGLPLDQKHFRIAELEQRVREADELIAKDPAASRQLARHCLSWLDELGKLFYSLADYQPAEDSFRKALAIADTLDDPELTTGRLYNNLGNVYLDRAEFERAREHFDRALKIDEKVFGPDHPNVAAYVNNLGRVRQALGDLPGARHAFERALKIDEHAFGPDHPNVAADVNNLGNVRQALGDLPGARQAFERALKIDEQAFGPDHPNVATDGNNLGSVLQALGDLPGARQAYEGALKIGEQAFGPDHPEVAAYLNNLGRVLQVLGDRPGAKQAFERALKIDEQAFGPDHPNVAARVNNLGLVLKDLGDLPGARQAFERALGIFRKFLGDEHPSTKLVRWNLEGANKLIGSATNSTGP